MDWKGNLYVFGLPFLTFVIDLGMRRLIKMRRLNAEEWCYGADLGLAGITTGIACIPELKKADQFEVAITLFVSLACWIWPMILHQAYMPALESHNVRARWTARILLLCVANVIGAFGMTAVLRLMQTTW